MARPKASSPLPEFKDHTGEIRRLGTTPPPPGFVAPFRAPLPALIPESEWEEFEIEDCPVKVKNQGSYGACFPAGTRVRMEDGSERRIEDVRLLDRVLTAEGNIGRVVRTMVRDADDGLLRLTFWGHSHLRCTAEHPILTRRGYVKAGSLTLKDWVAMPRYAPATKRFVHVADHLPLRVMTVRAGKGRRHFNAPQGRTEISVALRAVPEVIELTPGVGRIFGLFLAEGSTSDGKTVWSFNQAEEETLVADLVRLLHDEWGIEARVQHRSHHVINVIVYGSGWAKLFESLCATGSGSKRIHPDLASGPRDFLEAMLGGWLDGDGHERRGTVQGVTISWDLAVGMFDIAQALGRCPSIRRYQSATYGTVKTRRARWEVTMGTGDRSDNYRCEMDDTHVWRKVKGLELEDFDGPVYNLEVEGDNSYVAEGVGVHNCNGHAAATSLEYARWVAGEEHIDLSAFYVYAELCQGIDRGSMISDALEMLVREGTCPEALVPHGTINPRKLSPEARQQAHRFQVEIGAAMTMFEQMMSQTQLRRFGNFSLCVGNGFDDLDADGCPRVARGAGNHAITYGLGAKRGKNGEWLIKWRNSWGERWGLNGDAWIRKAAIANQSYFESYGISAVEADPERNDPLPVAS